MSYSCWSPVLGFKTREKGIVEIHDSGGVSKSRGNHRAIGLRKIQLASPILGSQQPPCGGDPRLPISPISWDGNQIATMRCRVSREMNTPHHAKRKTVPSQDVNVKCNCFQPSCTALYECIPEQQRCVLRQLSIQRWPSWNLWLRNSNP